MLRNGTLLGSLARHLTHVPILLKKEESVASYMSNVRTALDAFQADTLHSRPQRRSILQVKKVRSFMNYYVLFCLNQKLMFFI